LGRMILVFVVVCIPIHAGQLSPKDILVKNRDAVVQIFINGVINERELNSSY